MMYAAACLTAPAEYAYKLSGMRFPDQPMARLVEFLPAGLGYPNQLKISWATPAHFTSECQKNVNCEAAR
jgi:hypothetical protein